MVCLGLFENSGMLGCLRFFVNIWSFGSFGDFLFFRRIAWDVLEYQVFLFRLGIIGDLLFVCGFLGVFWKTQDFCFVGGFFFEKSGLFVCLGIF